MCGIICWDTRDFDIDQQNAAVQSVDQLTHRGPDFSCVQRHESYLLGFHRLAIINPTPQGNQPIRRGNFITVCNGQIYNYKKLAEKHQVDYLQTDVAIIPEILAHVDSVSSALRCLDGDFAFVALAASRDTSPSTPQILVARDPVGVRPLFYATNSEGKPFAFASEMKVLVDGPGVRGIHRFPPGHYWTPEGFVEYTDIYNVSNSFFCKSYSVAKGAVRSLLTAAVRKRIEHTDRPFAFLCSGGVDSCILVAIAHEILSSAGKAQDMMAFSMQYEDPRSSSDDAMYAEMFLRSLQVPHTAVTFSRSDIQNWYTEVVQVCETYDPNTVRAALPMFLLAKHISTHTDYKVLLSGENADEVMLGYNYFHQVPDSISANQESMRLVKNIHSFDILRADRVFAAHGLEIRVPFADRNFLKFMFYTDAKLRSFRDGVEKALLRDAFSHISALQCVIRRPKERASDGVGFSYIPNLFDFALNEQGIKASVLSEKEDAEKRMCRNQFEQIYGDNFGIIIDREMPDWCKKADTRLLAA